MNDGVVSKGCVKSMKRVRRVDSFCLAAGGACTYNKKLKSLVKRGLQKNERKK
jgi:hypothetical protein